jgi:hypothetical protein
MAETDYGKLIGEAREYVDALQGGENSNWMRLVALADLLADAVEALVADMAEDRRALNDAIDVANRNKIDADALRVQSDRAHDVLNTASWRAPEGTFLGELLAPYRRSEHLLGRPAVEVEGDKSNE